MALVSRGVTQLNGLSGDTIRSCVLCYGLRTVILVGVFLLPCCWCFSEYCYDVVNCHVVNNVLVSSVSLVFANDFVSDWFSSFTDITSVVMLVSSYISAVIISFALDIISVSLVRVC